MAQFIKFQQILVAGGGGGHLVLNLKYALVKTGLMQITIYNSLETDQTPQNAASHQSLGIEGLLVRASPPA